MSAPAPQLPIGARPVEEPVLQVHGLRIETEHGIEIVDQISFEVSRGEIFALVGESGCGKSSVALGLLGFARAGARISTGAIRVGDIDMPTLDAQRLRTVRGSRISYVPQDPSKGLSPRRTIISQMVETLTVHGVKTDEARTRCIEAIREVELPADESFINRYPFELSGGQQQRILIAMALVGRPSVIVLDEPTTALDATSQKKIIGLVSKLAARRESAFVYVTHDLAVVQEIAHRVGVMYSGRLVEVGSCTQIFRDPTHPYTAELLNSVPSVITRRVIKGIPGTAAQPGERPSGCFFRTRCPAATEQCAEHFPAAAPAHGDGYIRCFHPHSVRVEVRNREEMANPDTDVPELEVRNLIATYGRGSRENIAVDDISFSIGKAECVAIVGESGSGKSTTGRCIAGLHLPSNGEILFRGAPLPNQAKDRTREQLQQVQIVFQNPDRSLNPSHTIRSIVGRPLEMLGGTRATTAELTELLERVQLSARVLGKYPSELSGGEKQRVAIARALAARPSIIICDEVTSALDVSVQATIVNLLDDLRQSGVSLLFITHNLGVVRSLANRAVVMKDGHVIEQGNTATIFEKAQHPYTQALYNAVPEMRLIA
ncbi:ABC transporter ATP-binding protein [Arthrobacter sp. OV608]|uniref:ABC transporter ATP-binding protein n=1 Tax=Arthrobacter sp. OV608 TaxID=1882768 RepID=UPI0008CDEC21|nr:ABC transporter ATP-binding protein [Arthrobacter sp. OV608]SER34039.1 peptide/nickel transport system ATP-binding protein [Arthrobacter sp. OV608]